MTDMYGKGMLKGLGVTFRHFMNTYLEDIRWLARGKRRYYTEEGIENRKSTDASGIFTVQYPEEKLPVPEEFRFIPFLIYEVNEEGEKQDRCTSCGICAKVCPPQCIWIERTNNPETGRPIPEPAEFYIDVDICMNCGLCAEFCPFDAIKEEQHNGKAVASVISASCKGCGMCNPVCPSDAIDLIGYTNDEIEGMIESMILNA